MDPFVGIPLSHISLEMIESLIARLIPESLYVDYKQSLDLESDKAKKDFLIDVTSFANAHGGLLIWGVAEQRDSMGKPTGLPSSAPGFDIPNQDVLRTTIDAMLRDGIDERLPAVELAFVQTRSTLSILLMRINQSPRAPHMVTLGKERRFHRRVNGGNEPMTTPQIRDAVMQSNFTMNRIEHFHNERFATVSGLHSINTIWMLHINPLMPRIDPIDMASKETISKLKSMRVPYFENHGVDQRHCLEGYQRYFSKGNGQQSHVLLFRDGALEFADHFLVGKQVNGEEHLLNPQHLHNELASCIKEAIRLVSIDLVPFPFVLSLAFSKFRRHFIQVTDSMQFSLDQRYLPKGNLRLPPQVVYDIDSDPYTILKPTLDTLWQAAGFPRCPAFDDDGVHVGYRDYHLRLT